MNRWPHQDEGLALLRSRRANYLNWRMGAGKSRVIVDTVRERGLPRTLILCPKSVVAVWPAEFAKHWPDVDAYDIVALGSGGVTKRCKELVRRERLAVAGGRQFVAVINYEAAHVTPLGAKRHRSRIVSLGTLREIHWDLLVCDEAHRLKRPRGVASLFVHALAKNADHVVALSGTPFPHSPWDAFAQFRFLDESLFGLSFTRFRNMFPFAGTVQLGTIGKWFTVRGDFRLTSKCNATPRPGRFWDGQLWRYPITTENAELLCGMFARDPTQIDDAFRTACANVGVTSHNRMVTIDMAAMTADFQERVNRIMHKAETVPTLEGLSEPMHTTRRVALGAEAARVYSELYRDFVADVRGGKLAASNVLARILRLQQITGGCVTLEKTRWEGETPQVAKERIDDSKTQALIEYLDDLPPTEPVVVFARFHADLDAIHEAAEKANRKSVELSGRRNDIGAKWLPGDDTVLAVQVQAGGLGVDFTRARYCVWYSLSYSMGEFDQCLGRLYRPGQTRHVLCTHLVATDTVDEQIYQAIEAKRNVVEHVLAGCGEAPVAVG